MAKEFRVYCIATADTKLEELLYLSSSVQSNLSKFSINSNYKVKVTVVDVSASQKEIENFGDISCVTRKEILSCYYETEQQQPFNRLPNERSEAISVMSKALDCFLRKTHENGTLAGAVGLGGSGGTSLISAALKSLPLGIPKFIISTVASGQTSSYIGTSDLVLLPTVVDICGINSISQVVLSNAGAAVAGMVVGRLLDLKNTCKMSKKPTVGITMFGITTPCVNAVKERLETEGYEALVFHATGVGGKAMEDLVRHGSIQAVLDITTSEVADYILGGIMPCDSSRFDAIIEKEVPLVLSIGALDVVNFGPKNSIPSEFHQRNILVHNDKISVMRTTADENKKFASFIASKLNKASSKIRICLPQKGLSSLDAPGKPFYDPNVTATLINELERLVVTNDNRQVKRCPYHINDAAFANALVDSFMEITVDNLKEGSHQEDFLEGNQDHQSTSSRTASFSIPTDFPDARPETLQRTRKILQQLREQINKGIPIIGAGAGTGISAKFEEIGGVDLILVYNSGRFRMSGRGSLAGMLPFADANAVVLDMANEVLPVVKEVPVLAGVCATDPFRRMDYFLKQLESLGFVGVQNFPTVGLFDGNFRKNLEETGMGYGLEVEMIRKAHSMGLLTTPYAFNRDEAISMAKSGADIIVAHMGLTTSGSIGAKTAISLEDSIVIVQAIADAASIINPNVIILCHGGPISGPKEAEFVLKRTKGVHGFYGASSLERLPVEQAITNTIREYKLISLDS
ncbi:hypothetical protein MKW98_013090 [Papaver atlanticum]|uniref:Tm-1 protein n=1 Tax=Papaver atlanticum TaxID=357466 RepID=A0AAD4T9L0_9MAGN|nr:hypothetical protein MKW98_013090 [Papaver atlanticum]